MFPRSDVWPLPSSLSCDIISVAPTTRSCVPSPFRSWAPSRELPKYECRLRLGGPFGVEPSIVVDLLIEPSLCINSMCTAPVLAPS